MSLASTAAEGVCLTALQVYNYQSLHTATPGTTGASEVSGSGYGRQVESWASPSSGSMSNSAPITQTVPATTTVVGAGHWTTVTVGVYGTGALLGSSVTFSTSGTLTFAIGADTISIS
jgi:hypothetical protein